MLKFKVRELAIDRGFKNAAELSREAKIGQATAYDLWESRRSDAAYSTLLAIAKVLGVSPDDLVEEVPGESHGRANGDKIRGPHLLAA
jgi:DNA-binding Xre family transcriptional regulator